MMTGKIKKTAAAFALAFSALTLAANAETLRIGTEGTYKPWTMADANGKVSGFDADMANAVCKKLGADCVWKVQNLETLIPAVANGKFDMIWSSVSATAARAKKVDFSVPYAMSRGRFVIRANSPLAQIKDKDALFKALADKPVGAESGTIYAQYLQAGLPDSKIQLYGTFNELLTDLGSGRLDAAYEDITVWGDYLANNKNSGFVYSPVDIKSDPKGILGGGASVGFRKGDNALRERVNKAICALEADGTVKKLSEKWFSGEDISVPCKTEAQGAAK